MDNQPHSENMANTGHDEIPNGIKPSAQDRTFRDEYARVRYVYRERKAIYGVIIWSVYLFQAIMATFVICKAISDMEYSWLSHWSVAIALIASLFAIAKIEKDIIYRDDNG